MTESVERMELPAATADRQLGDRPRRHDDRPHGRLAVPAPSALAANVSRTLDQWTRTVTSPSRPRLVVQLDPPGPGGVWLVSVQRTAGQGRARPGRRRAARPNAAAGRSPASGRASTGCSPRSTGPGVRRRGQVALSQDEAWEFMTVVGPDARRGRVRRAGARSCRGASRRRRCDCSPRARPGSVVGAHQLSNVAWSVLFDDVELTAAEIAAPRPPGAPARAVARPLGRGRSGRSRTGRRRARRARVGHAADRRRDPAPQHRSRRVRAAAAASSSTATAGPTTSSAAPATRRWRRSPSRRASPASCAPTRPRRWRGSASSTPAELGGCLALDMGLGKTPTVLAHLARDRGRGTRRSSSLRPRSSATGRPRPPGSRPGCASSCTTARRGRRRRSSPPRSPAPTS